MKKFIFLLLLWNNLFSQDTVETYINSKNFPKVYNQIISSTLTGDNDVNNIGSYISLDIVKPKVTANLTIPNFDSSNSSKKLVGLLNLSFQGGTNDGIASIFKEDEFNTDISLRINYSFFPSVSMKSISAYRESLKQKKKKVNRNYFLKSNRIDLLYEKQELLNKKLPCSIIKLETVRLKDEIVKTELEILSLPGKNLKEKKDSLEIKRIKQIEKLDLTAKWSAVQLFWVSPYMEYSNQKLFLFNMANEFENQTRKITPDNFELGLSINWFYNQKKGLNRNIKGYWANVYNGLYSLSYSYSKTNNISELSSESILKKTLLGNENNQSRSILKNITAYEESQYDDFNAHKINVDINKKLIDRLYLHLSYELNFISNSDKFKGNYQNLAVGTIISLKDKKNSTKKSYLNIEPFATFRDLSGKFEENQGEEFYKRVVIGLRTTIPLGHLYKKKN